VVVELVVTLTVVVLLVDGFFELLVDFFAFLEILAEEKPETVRLFDPTAVTLPLAKPTLPAPPNRPPPGGRPDPPPGR
jgi:hypothetical protein